ncbi:MAG: YhbY family RNA-binding protein [Candidimonas sp.]
MPKLDITSQERSALRAAAHSLRPVVLIGDKGLSDAVLKEIDLNLKAHQLIKVRVAGDDRQARVQMLESICDALSCAPIHHLGKMLILYRPDAGAVAKSEKAETTRAVRKPSEPHTPKKQAAQGVTLTRRTEKQKRQASLAARNESAAPRERRLAGAAARPAIGIPRRTGRSALSLRAGSRRVLGAGKR